MEVWEDSQVRSDDVPEAYVADGTWPNVTLREDAPVSAYYGLALARKLAYAIAASDTSLRALGERAGVSHTTVSRLLAGRVLVDIGTVARIEAALGAEIWPGLGALAQRRTDAGTGDGTGS
ncbi:helix-turn-helix transcriptional regulator [Actinospica sp. MGRD01-02]|uniref:Helix-turn-helix transcriptional regulator n=1 Tax=Actinospica acidithermotolerans TaxID=2828514 RepID=A0A941ECV0_9ACTN|nr:helix-turn-helix transcriptional regulator [Actinospica acidithermotolerans]MBR7828142.1 helix-turn-helix transcriptional regulator [Actinospica acidithermotolerans]